MQTQQQGRGRKTADPGPSAQLMLAPHCSSHSAIVYMLKGKRLHTVMEKDESPRAVRPGTQRVLLFDVLS